MSYIEKARNFLKVMANELDKIHGCGWTVPYKKAISNYNYEFGTNYRIRCGAVRVAIIGDGFVIKVNYDKENVERFGGCEQEYKFWQQVKDTEHAYMFAPVTKVKAGHHYYYIMPCMDYLASDSDYLDIYDNVSEADYDWLMDTVGDLHENNYGVLDGELYIIDYAFIIE